MKRFLLLLSVACLAGSAHAQWVRDSDEFTEDPNYPTSGNTFVLSPDTDPITYGLTAGAISEAINNDIGYVGVTSQIGKLAKRTYKWGGSGQPVAGNYRVLLSSRATGSVSNSAFASGTASSSSGNVSGSTTLSSTPYDVNPDSEFSTIWLPANGIPELSALIHAHTYARTYSPSVPSSSSANGRGYAYFGDFELVTP